MGRVVTIHPAGTRVRLTESCPWEERRGCTATVVAPPVDGTYPQPSKSEVLLLVDDDPLRDAASVYHFGERSWSCVTDTKDCEVLG